MIKSTNDSLHSRLEQVHFVEEDDSFRKSILRNVLDIHLGIFHFSKLVVAILFFSLLGILLFSISILTNHTFLMLFIIAIIFFIMLLVIDTHYFTQISIGKQEKLLKKNLIQYTDGDIKPECNSDLNKFYILVSSIPFRVLSENEEYRFFIKDSLILDSHKNFTLDGYLLVKTFIYFKTNAPLTLELALLDYDSNSSNSTAQNNLKTIAQEFLSPYLSKLFVASEKMVTIKKLEKDILNEKLQLELETTKPITTPNTDIIL